MGLSRFVGQRVSGRGRLVFEEVILACIVVVVMSLDFGMWRMGRGRGKWMGLSNGLCVKMFGS